MKTNLKSLIALSMAVCSLYTYANDTDLKTTLDGLTKEQLIECLMHQATSPCASSPKPSQNASIEAQELLKKAILNNSAEEIAAAVKAGANVNQDIEEKAPLLWAILLRNNNAIDELLKAGARPNTQLMTYARSLGDFKSLVLLIKASGLSLNDYDQRRGEHESLLFDKLAQDNDYASMLLYLQNKGMLPSGKICESCYNSYDDMVKNFLRNLFVHYDGQAQNVKYPEQTNLKSQSADTKIIIEQIVYEFLRRGYNINQMWEYVSSDYGAKLLLKNGANVNYIIPVDKNSDNNGRESQKERYTTPLGKAVLGVPSVSWVQTLLDAGANVNQKIDYTADRWNHKFTTAHTPLAAMIPLHSHFNPNAEWDKESIKIVRLLLEHGARLEVDANPGKGFAAGTLIKTPIGYKPIEQLKENDIVFCYDRNDNKKNLKQRPITGVRKTHLSSYIRFQWADGFIDVGPKQLILNSDASTLLESAKKYRPNYGSGYLCRLTDEPSACNPNQWNGLQTTNEQEITQEADFYEIVVGEFNTFFLTKQDIIINNE